MVGLPIGEQLGKILSSLTLEAIIPPRIEYGEPVVAKIVPPLSTTILSDQSTFDGVNLGTLISGNFPLQEQFVPHFAGIKWEVYDSDGKTRLIEGQDYKFLSNSIGVPQAIFAFAPKIIELSTDIDPLKQAIIRYIRVTVAFDTPVVPVGHLSSALPVTPSEGVIGELGVTDELEGEFEPHPWLLPTFTLPDLPVVVPALPIPTFALFARDPVLEGAKLLVVPDSSPLQSLENEVISIGRLLELLRNLNFAITALAKLFAFFLRLHDSINFILTKVKGLNVAYRRGEAIRNFNNIDLISGEWNDTEAEDELSSLLFFGPPRRKMVCFQHRNFQGPKFSVTLGDSYIAILPRFNIRVDPPMAGEPYSMPHEPSDARIEADEEVSIYDGEGNSYPNPDYFANVLSSMVFDWADPSP